MRKGEGLTHAKIAKCPELRRLFGASSVDRVLAAISGMGSDVKVKALVNAFGLVRQEDDRLVIPSWTPASRNLTARRSSFAIERGVAPETILDYENRTIEELAARLLSVPAIPDEIASTELHVKAEVTGYVITFVMANLIMWPSDGDFLGRNDRFRSLHHQPDQLAGQHKVHRILQLLIEHPVCHQMFGLRRQPTGDESRFEPRVERHR